MPLPVNAKYFLLDTCIAEYLLDRYLQDSVREQLGIWTKGSFNTAISKVSYAEMLDGAYKEKTTAVKKLLDDFIKVSVTQRIFGGSGILNSIYKTQSKSFREVGLADRIIAATSFVHNFPIITANIQDFPHPFFTTIFSENICYKKKNKASYITIDVLKPNITLLNYWYLKTK